MSFLLRGLIHFVRMSNQLQDLGTALCRGLVVIENFLIEASFTWVFVEALFLHNSIFVHVLSDGGRAWKWMYITLGWGIPCFVMTIWIATRLAFEDSTCWVIDHRNISKWILICYPTVTILLNVVFFINITREIFLKLRHGPVQERHRYRKFTKSTFVLVLVFGLYHLVSIPVELNGTYKKSDASVAIEIVQLYYTHLLVTFQGFIVALLFCFFNREVIGELKRHLCHHDRWGWVQGNTRTGGDFPTGGVRSPHPTSTVGSGGTGGTASATEMSASTCHLPKPSDSQTTRPDSGQHLLAPSSTSMNPLDSGNSSNDLDSPSSA